MPVSCVNAATPKAANAAGLTQPSVNPDHPLTEELLSASTTSWISPISASVSAPGLRTFASSSLASSILPLLTNHRGLSGMNKAHPRKHAAGIAAPPIIQRQDQAEPNPD